MNYSGQNHDNKIPGMSSSYLNEKLIHVFGVHLRSYLVIKTTISGTDGSVGVHKFPDQCQTDHGAAMSGCPTLTRITHPPESRFVLKYQSDRQSVDVLLASGSHRPGKFFLNSA